MKKIVVSILVLTVLCLSVFGLIGCRDKKTKDGDLTVVKLNEVTHSVFYAPLYVAINNGYFTEQGLKIELTNGGGSDKSMTAVMSKQADIGLMGPEAAVYVKLQGSTNYPIVFGQLTKKDGSFLIGRKPEPNFSWSNLANKEVIGGRTGGMPAMCLEYALKKNNLISGSNVTINYDVQFDLIASAFQNGTGDYCTMFEPAATNFQNAGKGHIVTSVGSESGNVPYTCFMARKDYILNNRDTVIKFMTAIMKGIKFVTEQNDKDIAQALAPSFDGTPLEVIESSVRNYKAIDAFMTTPIMSESNFEHLLDILQESKKISSRVAFSDIIDNSIARSLAG